MAEPKRQKVGSSITLDSVDEGVEPYVHKPVTTKQN